VAATTATAEEDVVDGEVGEVGEQDSLQGEVGEEKQEAGVMAQLRPKQFSVRGVRLVVAAAFVAAEDVATLNAGFLTQQCAAENFMNPKIRIASCVR